MGTEFLVQMRQSNKFGSVRNDEIFNLHLGSGVGPGLREVDFEPSPKRDSDKINMQK